MVSPWDEVGDGCFRRRYETFDLNIGVVRGSDGVLVFDTRCHTEEAEELLDELRALGRAPVRRIVNSHWHFDHHWGNERFVQQSRTPMPGFAAVATDLEIWAQARFVEGLDHETAAAKEWLSTSRPEWASLIGALQLAFPDRLVDDEHVIDLGDREVVLRHPGRGHTDNDLVLVASDSDVVYAGDIVEESAPPAYGDDSFPLEWPASNTAPARVDHARRHRRPRPRRHDDECVRRRADHRDRRGRAGDPRAARGRASPERDALDATEWPFPAATLATAVRRGYRAVALADGSHHRDAIRSPSNVEARRAGPRARPVTAFRRRRRNRDLPAAR